MRIEINADIIIPMPDAVSGIGFQEVFVGISKTSAYGRQKSSTKPVNRG